MLYLLRRLATSVFPARGVAIMTTYEKWSLAIMALTLVVNAIALFK